MVDLNQLESRVAVLEQELAELKKAVRTVDGAEAWVDKLSGRFKDDPDFDEMVRLGRKYRQSVSDESEA